MTGFVRGTVDGLAGDDGCQRLGIRRRRWWGANKTTGWAEETNGERKARVAGLEDGVRYGK